MCSNLRSLAVKYLSEISQAVNFGLGFLPYCSEGTYRLGTSACLRQEEEALTLCTRQNYDKAHTFLVLAPIIWRGVSFSLFWHVARPSKSQHAKTTIIRADTKIMELVFISCW